jgi:hypothetical protein
MEPFKVELQLYAPSALTFRGFVLCAHRVKLYVHMILDSKNKKPIGSCDGDADLE